LGEERWWAEGGCLWVGVGKWIEMKSEGEKKINGVRKEEKVRNMV
jgi:hypothetical protein